MKRLKKSKFFRPVHLQTLLFLIVYHSISKTILVKSILNSSLMVNFLGPYVFGVAAGIIFLYLLKHEDFFHFMKEIEKDEKKKEDGFLKKYLHHGKILATIIIATIGGPIFGALTIRLLLPKYKYPYILLVIGNIPSTILTIGIAKGLLVSII